MKDDGLNESLLLGSKELPTDMVKFDSLSAKILKTKHEISLVLEGAR